MLNSLILPLEEKNMDSKVKVSKKNYLWSVLNNKCPRCREGNMFVSDKVFPMKNYTSMHANCPVCGQRTEIEVGFYYGTGYVSYGITVAFSVFTFVAWWILIGFSLEDNRLFWWIGINAFLLIILQLYFMRISRTMWLSFFVRYNPQWGDENKE